MQNWVPKNAEPDLVKGSPKVQRWAPKRARQPTMLVLTWTMYFSGPFLCTFYLTNTVLMAVCIGMKLRLCLIESIFDKSQNKLNRFQDPDKTYYRILERFPGVSMNDFNGMLKAAKLPDWERKKEFHKADNSLSWLFTDKTS